MAQVYYYNGQFYDRPISGMASAAVGGSGNFINMNNIKPIGAPTSMVNPVATAPMSGVNYFNNVNSGGIAGTLQPYVNKQTDLANRALNGGLLNFQPQQLTSGNAGGQTITTQSPEFNLESALLNKQFGNREWMGK